MIAFAWRGTSHQFLKVKGGYDTLKNLFAFLLAAFLLLAPLSAVSLAEGSGTWGGIDWKLTDDGTLTISPTKGTPVPDTCGIWTYEVGEWREAVTYNSDGTEAAIGGWPYNRSEVKKLIIEEGVTKIGSFTVNGYTNLTGEVVIPSTVTYIGQEAFQKSTFTKITYALGGTEPLCIAVGAHKNLIVEEIEFPHDRPEIHVHQWQFLNSPNLKHVTFPANVTIVHGSHHVDYKHNSTSGENSDIHFFMNANGTDGTPALEKLTFGSEEVKAKILTSANPLAANKEYILEVVEKVVTPLADPVVQNSIPYGKKLSDVKLSDGWMWVNPDLVPKIGEASYLACFIPEDMINYDYSSLPGWNKDTQRIERMAAVTVLPVPASPPQTGDDSSLFLFVVLAVMSVLGMVVLKKREQF